MKDTAKEIVGQEEVVLTDSVSAMMVGPSMIVEKNNMLIIVLDVLEKIL